MLDSAAVSRSKFMQQMGPRPGLFTICPTATPSGPGSAAFRSVVHPHRTGEYASGVLGRETPQLRRLTAFRYGRLVNKPG